MASHPRTPRPRGDRRGRQLRPCLLRLEQRVVPSLTFPGIAGITFDTSGDVFVSYDSTTGSRASSSPSPRSGPTATWSMPAYSARPARPRFPAP